MEGKYKHYLTFSAASAYLFGLGNKILLLDLETMNQIFGWLKIIFAEGKEDENSAITDRKVFPKLFDPNILYKS